MKILIQPLPGQSRALAFGLQWQTILGEKLEEVARKLAGRNRATHYTRGGSRSTVAGLLTLTRAERKEYARFRLYSAAAAFARAFPNGISALVWDVPNGTWLAGAADGLVLSGTDVIYPSKDAALAALNELRSRYGNLVVYGDVDDARTLDTQALTEHFGSATELKLATRLIERIPTPLWVALGVGASWFLVQQAWNWYDERLAARETAVMQAVQVDPVHEWQRVLNQWAHTVAVHSRDDLRQMLHSIGETPVQAGRWELLDISCNFAGATCTAQYARTHLADNLSLINNLPQHWQVKFLNLNAATATWRVDDLGKRTLDLKSLPNQYTLNTTWSSLYQRLAPALSEISLSQPAEPQDIQPPFHSGQDGQMVPIPFPKDRLTMPLVRELSISGPMRTLYAIELPGSASLGQLHIRRAPTSQVDVSNSTMLVTLNGKVYGQ